MIQVESDSLQIIQGIKSSQSNSSFDLIIDDIKELESNFFNICFMFVKRYANKATNLIARSVLFKSDCTECFHFLFPCVNFDMNYWNFFSFQKKKITTQPQVLQQFYFYFIFFLISSYTVEFLEHIFLRCSTTFLTSSSISEKPIIKLEITEEISTFSLSTFAINVVDTQAW